MSIIIALPVQAVISDFMDPAGNSSTSHVGLFASAVALLLRKRVTVSRTYE